MKFFSGFSLQNESYLFQPYIKESDFSVCGFSYGALKALKFVEQSLQNAQRIDTLQLFSPAFFQTKEQSFKKLQLRGYTKNQEQYLQSFLQLCFAPYEMKIVEQSTTFKVELEELLNYKWDSDILKYIKDKGVAIEVYLGSEDKIIDVSGAREFFLDVADVTFIKGANHFLQTN